MRAERITREEILAAVRASGDPDQGQIAAAVVLETDGSLSVVPNAGAGAIPALDTVRRIDDDHATPA
jgi:uncharacterized membrane protein YcaP (DUF421 family)